MANPCDSLFSLYFVHAGFFTEAYRSHETILTDHTTIPSTRGSGGLFIPKFHFIAKFHGRRVGVPFADTVSSASSTFHRNTLQVEAS